MAKKSFKELVEENLRWLMSWQSGRYARDGLAINKARANQMAIKQLKKLERMDKK